jgi:hypothetical protein
VALTSLSSVRPTLFLALAVFVVGAGCQPFGGLGAPCDDSPCAVGLICSDGVCAEPPPPPPPPCVDDAECAVDGDASGRVCDAGVCRFADCVVDAQCGTRICVDGTCTETSPCIDDDDCGQTDGVPEVCENNQCRPPCFADDDCGVNVGGIGLQACVDGRCEQRCLGDFTCLGGGLCDDGTCRDPDCADDVDCGADDEFCDAGRCTPFTACAIDDDCFDVNFFCDVEATPVRCAERPACRADNECGAAALCLDRHCRPAEGCFFADDCDDPDDECVGGRCVRAPDCRESADCPANQVCADLRCQAPAEPGDAEIVVVEDGLAVCTATCARTLLVGESAPWLTMGFDAGGLPVAGAVAAVVSDAAVVAVDVSAGRAVVRALAAGRADVTFGAGAGAVTVAVTVRPTSAGRDVVVVDDAGVGVADANVSFGADVGVTDAFGVVSFDAAAAGDIVVVDDASDRGAVLLASLTAELAADVRVVLSSTSVASTQTQTAPLSVTVASTGDEIGPVGVGVALPGVQRLGDVGLTALFGDVVFGTANLPVIGEVPIPLPSAMTLDASLPLVGEQVVRAAAEIGTVPGPAFVFALEDRREQQDLVALALGGDPIGLALDFAEQSEGMDAAVVAAGVVADVDLVADDDDRDGDGDTTELRPDYANATAVEARPFGPPRQRTSIVATPPGEADARALVVLGAKLPGRLLIAGTGVVRGAVGFEGQPISEPQKLIPTSPTLVGAPQFAVVAAVFADATLSSQARFVGDGLPPVMELGVMLAPPTGAFLLQDIPADGDVSVVVPAFSAAVVRVDLNAAGRAVVVYGRGDDGVVVPAAFADDVVLVAVSAIDVDVDVFAVGAGAVDVVDAADKVATAREP